ncbi:MAG: CD225/dispanin family protein, partial [Muribaculaceae bacterium]|nr:CD225/dispanin family protein [Muribaculaceae bacterium]
PVQPTNSVNMQQPVDHGGRRCRSSLALSIFALISVFLLYIIFVTSLTYAFSRYESREWLPMVAFMAMLANTVLGIIALVMSIKSRLSFNRQYYEISERRGRTAFILGLIALIIFVIVAGLCIFS